MDLFNVALLFVVLALTLCFQLFTRRRAAKKLLLAPGPYPLPIIGNIIQLGPDKNAHQSLANLSAKYGPLMSLQLGGLYTVVVSSADRAKEILHKHDQAISSRNIPVHGHAHDHDKVSVGFLPAVGNPLWRKLRKLSKEQLFLNNRLEASQGLRQEKLQKLLDYVQSCCDGGRTVDIAEAAFITTLNLMSATLFSTEVATFESGAAQEFKNTFETFTNVMGTPNLADYFPVLKLFDVQGLKRDAQICLGKMLSHIQDAINQRLKEYSSKGSTGSKKIDLLDTLLALQQPGGEYEFSMKIIKHFLLDLFVAGSDTSSGSVVWALTELLLHPEKLCKAKQEIKDVLGEKKRLVEESDISRLPYLQAVIKETFRLRTPAPLLFPRKCDYDVQLNGGYTIPKGTQVIVNAWAMGRDPRVWKDPDSFEPERFLDNPIDFKGQDFELIPFGSGRRICPGLPLANRMVHIMVATLIHNFDWKLEAGERAEDKGERNGLALRRAFPLKIIPTKPALSSIE